MNLSILKPFMGFINSAALSQLRTLSAFAGGALATDGLIQGNQVAAATGTIFFVGSALLQLVDNYVVDGKITFAKNEPPPVPAAAPVTMQPIANPA